MSLGKCTLCGKGSFFLKTHECKICSKVTCGNCTIELYDMEVTAPEEPTYESKAYVCSERCFENFAKKVETSAPEISSFQDQIKAYLNKMLQTKDNQKWFNSTEQDLLNKKGSFSVNKPNDPRSSALWNAYEAKATQRIRENQRAATLHDAKQLETAGRFEDAAQKYEMIQMYKEAGRVRARSVPTIRTDISLDVNKLLDQVRNEGIDVVYRCPHCGGKLKIGKNATLE